VLKKFYLVIAFIAPLLLVGCVGSKATVDFNHNVRIIEPRLDRMDAMKAAKSWMLNPQIMKAIDTVDRDIDIQSLHVAVHMDSRLALGAILEYTESGYDYVKFAVVGLPPQECDTLRAGQDLLSNVLGDKVSSRVRWFEFN
jgi:hypothetical protein